MHDQQMLLSTEPSLQSPVVVVVSLQSLVVVVVAAVLRQGRLQPRLKSLSSCR